MKTLTKNLICIAVISASSVGMANAKNVSVIAKTNINSEAVSAIQAMPFNKKIKIPFDGYVKISIPEEFSMQVKDTLSMYGVGSEDDIKFSIDTKIGTPGYSLGVTQSAQEFNDPLRSEQLNLDENGIAEAISYKRPSTDPDGNTDEDKKQIVVVVDSGATPHEDVLYAGGFSYVSEELEDENLPEQIDRDPADYADYGVTYDSGEKCISGHGLAMAGIIGAQQNFVGITGIADVDIYMARVVATDCSKGRISPSEFGEVSDLATALSDLGGTSGIPTPDVVNISLAAKSTCPGYLQDEIDRLNDEGAVVVSSAGNNNGLASAYTPGNCRNVLNIGSHDVNGEKSSFSNYDESVLITTLGKQYTTVSSERYGFNYGLSTGTSGSAATVSASVAILKSKFEDITPSQVISLLKISSKPYPIVEGSDSSCATGCGAGMLDLHNAIIISEKIIEPEISFRHAFDDGDKSDLNVSNRRAEALDGLIGTTGKSCNAAIASIKSPHLKAETLPVSYAYQIQKRVTGNSTWTNVGDMYQPTEIESELPVTDLAQGYDYSVTPCYESDGGVFVCPASQARVIDASSLNYPTYCS